MISFSPPVILGPEHELSTFCCGKAPLDAFLKEHAFSRQAAMLSRTYVVTFAGSNVVAGYHTLAHISIRCDSAPKKISRGMPSSIPAILLARLAVDQSCQGLGLGRSLFSDALQRTWAVMRGSAAPVRFFVVDAMDEDVRAFYEQKGMIPSPHNPMRLFLHYKEVLSLFE